MGCSRRSLEGSDAESNVDCGDLACEVSDEISLLVMELFFLIKNMATFCFCPENLSEAKEKVMDHFL